MISHVDLLVEIEAGMPLDMINENKISEYQVVKTILTEFSGYI